MFNHFYHTQVYIGAEPPVEQDLLLAEELALFQAGVIEEAEVHRLLDLVDIIASEKDKRYLRLHQLNALGMVGISLWAQESLD
ncbi:MAG: hypothetical protein A2Y60_00745 [Chloroflexi bacterium RBG_13_54_9]|nr:MAG: hypothetical protein A2Y60_00745 [Chloroflexi bacterium RBG_13_54_9]